MPPDLLHKVRANWCTGRRKYCLERRVRDFTLSHCSQYVVCEVKARGCCVWKKVTGLVANKRNTSVVANARNTSAVANERNTSVVANERNTSAVANEMKEGVVDMRTLIVFATVRPLAGLCLLTHVLTQLCRCRVLPLFAFPWRNCDCVSVVSLLSISASKANIPIRETVTWNDAPHFRSRAQPSLVKDLSLSSARAEFAAGASKSLACCRRRSVSESACDMLAISNCFYLLN